MSEMSIQFLKKMLISGKLIGKDGDKKSKYIAEMGDFVITITMCYI